MNERDNSGVLFKNDHKEKDTQPDYRGKCKVNGVDMEMSAWIKQGQSGKFMSFAFSEPYAKPDQQAKPSGGAPFNDPIPFARVDGRYV